MAQEESVDLPPECLEQIINLVDSHDFSSLSLVSKQFLSITNPLVFTLKLSDATPQTILIQLLRRFPRLKTIDLSGFTGDMYTLLGRISLSGLNLETLILSNQTSFPVEGLRLLGSKMMSLRCLNCSRVSFLQDSDLGVIAESFPLLQELDISYPEYGSPDSKPISDSGLLSLTLKLKGLEKIDLSGNHFITDMSLVHLSQHCLLLTQVVIHSCNFVTSSGVAKLIRACTHLNHISVRGMGNSFELSFGLRYQRYRMMSSMAISVMDLSYSKIPDALLYSVAEACFPLKKLILSHCTRYTLAGISFLISCYPFIEYLDLEGATFLLDKDIIELSIYLTRITYINLSFCNKLTGITLYTLAQNCVVLHEIKMVGTNIGNEALQTDFVANLGVKSLNLSENSSLGNEVVANFASICPNLELLNLSSCVNITEDSIVEVLNKCSGIRHLEINECNAVENLLIDFELPRLEVLCARSARNIRIMGIHYARNPIELGIDDDALALIGKRCSRLQQLDLSGCLRVTENGVKEVVANCKELREINLRYCQNVCDDIVPWMVFSRPSLKKIVPPCGSVTESKRNHFLRHGCLVGEASFP